MRLTKAPSGKPHIVVAEDVDYTAFDRHASSVVSRFGMQITRRIDGYGERLWLVKYGSHDLSIFWDHWDPAVTITTCESTPDSVLVTLLSEYRSRELSMAKHVCPVWAGYILASPLRKLIQSPKKILGPHVSSGMKVLDVGCAMGFFSLALARLVGPAGRVVCVDLQEKMIRSLARRAHKAGLADRIEARSCRQDSLGLEDLRGQIDFALAFAVVHEVPDPLRLFGQIAEALKPHGRLLVAEPKWHVSARAFDASVSLAEQNGFEVVDRPRIARSHAVLLQKKDLGESPT